MRPRVAAALVLVSLLLVVALPHGAAALRPALSRPLLDVFPQFGFIARAPYTNHAPGAGLKATVCKARVCRHGGSYGLRLEYVMPRGTWGSYNVDWAGKFGVSRASYLEVWVKGSRGGERFELVLWSTCKAGFPGRPESALISAGTGWERRRVALADFRAYSDVSSLCRLSIGFNDAIHPGGTVFIDDVAFVDGRGRPVSVVSRP